MDAVNAGDGAQLLDQLDTESNADFFGVGRLFHLHHQLCWDPQTRNAIAHSARHVQRLDGQNARQNVCLLVQAVFAHLFHPSAKSCQIEDRLRLDEVRACSDFFPEAE